MKKIVTLYFLFFAADVFPSPRSSCDFTYSIPAHPLNAEVEITLAPGTTAIKLEESSADFEFLQDGLWQPISWPQSRFGVIELHLIGTRPSRVRAVRGSNGSLSITTICQAVSNGRSDTSARRNWLAQAEAFSARFESAQFTDLPDQATAEKLLQSAPLDYMAGALHVLARSNAAADHLAIAAIRYRNASKYFGSRDVLRSILSLIAAAETDIRAGNYESARIALKTTDDLVASASLGLQGRAKYLSARSFANQCYLADQLVITNPSDPNRAKCWSESATLFFACGEDDSAVQSQISLAYSLRDLGNPRSALTALLQTESLSKLAEHKTLGQAFLLKGILNRDLGEISGSLNSYASAYEHFAKVNEEGSEWRANTLLQVADIYRSLGLLDSAYLTLTEAIALYQSEQQPERIASALMKLSALDAANGLSARAVAMAGRAETIYRALGLEERIAEAKLIALESADLEVPQAKKLLLTPPDFAAAPARLQHRIGLVSAKLALRAADPARAQQLLAILAAQRLELAEQTQWVALEAQRLSATNKHDLARGTIAAHLSRLMERALASGNPALGYLVARLGAPLQGAWLQSALRDQLPAAEFWRVLAGSQALRAFSNESSVGAQKPSLDAALPSERILLEPLGRHTSRLKLAKFNAFPNLVQVQSTLPRGVWLMLLIPGDRQSAVVWLNSERAFVVAAVGQASLRAHVDALQRRLQSPETAMGDIQGAADSLSRAIFVQAPIELQGYGAGAGVGTAPSESGAHFAAGEISQLWLQNNELLAGVPLPLLRAFTSAPIFADYLQTSWVTQIAFTETGVHAPSPVFAAAQLTMIAAGTGNATQSALINIEQESHLIADGLGGRAIQLIQGSDAQPEALLDALRTTGSWLHVGAHGSAKASLLGRTGLWLAPKPTALNATTTATQTAEPVPQFVSWLDLTAQKLHANLVVLNACDLAGAPSGYRGAALAFAPAISSAGVAHVLAASRPLSDGATRLWVPALYRTLSVNQNDVSGALAASQNVLRQSRAFRHPYHWTALTHFRRIDVAR